MYAPYDEEEQSYEDLSADDLVKEGHLNYGDLNEMRQYVKNGALLLDAKRPGWEHEVRHAMTKGLFNMTQWETCIAGTLELVVHVGETFPDGTKNNDVGYICFNGTRIQMYHESSLYGFITPNGMDTMVYWEALDKLWREEIAARIDS